ncbi:MAG: SRPBCC domain-containing protein [Planctomycetota bacterium]
MARVHHRVGIKASETRVFESLVQADDLASWWSSSAECDGTDQEGGTIDLGFVGLTTLRFRVDASDAPNRLLLVCVGEPEIWQGSTLDFRVQARDGQTFLYLTHEKASATDEEFLFFNTKWPLFLVSLKDHLELEAGKPFPNDQRIDHG